jgi:hypothetical protein
MPLLKTKALPVSDVPNCESWVSMVVPKVDAASAAFVFGMEETRLKVACTSVL